MCNCNLYAYTNACITVCVFVWYIFTLKSIITKSDAYSRYAITHLVRGTYVMIVVLSS